MKLAISLQQCQCCAAPQVIKKMEIEIHPVSSKVNSYKYSLSENNQKLTDSFYMLKPYANTPYQCPPKEIMSYFQLQCPSVGGGHNGGTGQDHNEPKGVESVICHTSGNR